VLHQVVYLVEETNDLARDMLSSRLLVVHDAGTGCEDDVTELTGRKELDNPLLEISELDVVSWGDDTSLVETTVKLDDNFARSVVVDFLEFANITLTVLLVLHLERVVIHERIVLRTNKRIPDTGMRKAMCKNDRRKTSSFECLKGRCRWEFLKRPPSYQPESMLYHDLSSSCALKRKQCAWC